jgi:hypothetical protein
MGYTHYWTRTRQLSKDEMLTIGAKVRNIISEAEKQPATHNYNDEPGPKKLVIAGPNGEGSPEITKDLIMLNGADDWGHETFGIDPEPGSDFCKTAQKPYDVVVVACLTFLATDYGFRVSSDGDHEDLQPGVDLCCKALGRGYPHPLTVDIMLPTTVSDRA